MIESCHNGFKVMYMHMSIFLFSGLLQFAVIKFFMFCLFSVVLSMVGCKRNLRAFGCNLRDAKYKKRISLSVFDLKNFCSPKMSYRGMVIKI